MTQLTLKMASPDVTPRKPAQTGKNGYDHYRRDFVRLFSDIARYHHRHEVFRDFVEMASIAVQNTFLRSPELEQEYLTIAGRYQPDDVKRMAHLLACQPGDFLGQIFMELEIGSAHMGQFFTPYHLSQLMARLTVGNAREQLKHKSFITLHEAAAGAGSMVIAIAEVMAEQGVNYQDTLFASCMDIRLFDGQTRSRGIIDYIAARKDSPDTITLLLTEGLSLQARQQFFADINNNASKPATAISMAYNHKDPVNDLVRQIVSAVPALNGRVDYEHNVVPAKSDLLISFKALHDATRKMFGLRAGDEISDALREDAIRLWTAWG